jgi:hypothetical protein
MSKFNRVELVQVNDITKTQIFQIVGDTMFANVIGIIRTVLKALIAKLSHVLYF